MKTQCEKLLDYMKEHGSVTGMESIMQLGVPIKTTMGTVTNAQGEKKTFARYSLEG